MQSETANDINLPGTPPNQTYAAPQDLEVNKHPKSSTMANAQPESEEQIHYWDDDLVDSENEELGDIDGEGSSKQNGTVSKRADRFGFIGGEQYTDPNEYVSHMMIMVQYNECTTLATYVLGATMAIFTKCCRSMIFYIYGHSVASTNQLGVTFRIYHQYFQGCISQFNFNYNLGAIIKVTKLLFAIWNKPPIHHTCM